MNYTVTWTPKAEQDLAAIWMAAKNRDAVTIASHTIDQLLAQTPATVGSPRFDTVRSLVVPPLGVDYEIVDADRLVYVLSVWDVTTGVSTNGSTNHP